MRHKKRNREWNGDQIGGWKEEDGKTKLDGIYIYGVSKVGRTKGGRKANTQGRGRGKTRYSRKKKKLKTF